jgi:hypothetical protein
MKQYKKLYSFGCSFTEGGGMNNQNFHRYLTGRTDYTNYPEAVLPEHAEYARQQSYSGYLSRLLNCDFENHGTSCAGNEFIINKAYDTINGLENTNDILVTIQTSILSRMLLQMPLEKKAVNINNLDSIDGIVKTFYKLYITDFFDHAYANKKLIQQINILTSWFQSKKIEVLWLPYDMNFENVCLTKEIITFDNSNLGNYAHKNKLTITDLPGFPYRDSHFSPDGNKHIADIIYSHIAKT